MTIDTTKVNIFEEATRRKLRFETYKGDISVEDVWRLPIFDNVNTISIANLATDVSTKLKEFDDVNDILGVETAGKTSSTKEYELRLQLEILKAIASRKDSEAKEILAAKEKKEKREYIDRLINEKQSEELRGKSIDELREMREEVL